MRVPTPKDRVNGVVSTSCRESALVSRLPSFGLRTREVFVAADGSDTCASSVDNEGS